MSVGHRTVPCDILLLPADPKPVFGSIIGAQVKGKRAGAVSSQAESIVTSRAGVVPGTSSFTLLPPAESNTTHITPIACTLAPSRA